MNIFAEKKINGALLVDRFSMSTKAVAVVVGIVALTVSSYYEIPMVPVPMTMQTLAVLLIAALYGRVLGTITVASWLGLAVLGAPLLAGGTGGIAKFYGPTAGYLCGFLIATMLVGWFSDRGWNGQRPILAFIAMFIGGKIILGLGWAWLSTIIGPNEAWFSGVYPFIIGDLVKSILATLVLAGVYEWFTKKILG